MSRHSKSTDLDHELRSFGRKRGRKLSPRQEALFRDLMPKVALDLGHPCASAAALFEARPRQVWLEIGFGGGEHLLWQARHHPDTGIIGCEPYVEGIVKVLSAIEEGGHGNIRLHDDDARDVLRWLPAASISRAFILFPDPWPKRRHVKRRLVSPATLRLLVRVMAPGAELRIATDIGDYARTILLAVAATPELAWTAASPRDWRVRPDDWPQTRYEAKAVREGRRCTYLSFRRVA